jgi:hypothetical protein
MHAVAVQLDCRRFLAVVAAVLTALLDFAIAAGMRAFLTAGRLSHRRSPLGIMRLLHKLV